jgi:hypothetical protein
MYDLSFYQACMGQTQLVFNLKKTMVLVQGFLNFFVEPPISLWAQFLTFQDSQFLVLQKNS